MSFADALNALLEGKTVARRNWDDDESYRSGIAFDCVGRIWNEWKGNVDLWREDYAANDWYVVGEGAV